MTLAIDTAPIRLESMMARAITPGVTRIGWIGTGVMGTSMCGHLIAAGYSSTVFNRSPEKMAGLADQPSSVVFRSSAMSGIPPTPNRGGDHFDDGNPIARG